MLRLTDDQLNKVTMYKLLAYGLSILAALSVLLSFSGSISIPVTQLVTSLLVIVVTCGLANIAFAATWKIPTNHESWYITALILFFVMTPAASAVELLILALAGLIAVASKFLITWHNRHIFNPAALGAFAVATLGLLPATWWIGSVVLWPAALVFGLLVVRKIRRIALLLSFAVVSLVVAAILAAADGTDIAGALQLAITSSTLIFLGTIMLTEPATMPARRLQQVLFGALVGVLAVTTPDIGSWHIYPETALLIGNLFAFAVNPRYRLQLKLRRVVHYGDRVADYVFTPERQVSFMPGQYMEFTMPHIRYNSRGNRRTFSVASSPTESDMHVGVKFYEPSSAYKQALRAMQPGDTMYGGQLAGDFTLPRNQDEKLLFLAAGIGITPFRSILKYLVDTGQQRDVVLIYAVSAADELAYDDVLQAAGASGIRIIRLLTHDDTTGKWAGLTGRLTADLISEQVRDYRERTVYISGPNSMVDDVQAGLIGAGVRRTHIRTDHFSGY